MRKIVIKRDVQRSLTCTFELIGMLREVPRDWRGAAGANNGIELNGK